MKNWEKPLGAIGAVVTIGSAVLGLFGVSTFGMLKPFAMSVAAMGLFVGGLLSGWFARAAYEQRSTRQLRKLYDALDDERKQLLEDAYARGFVEQDWESEASGLYEGMSFMGFTELASGGVTYKWRLTDKCRRMMDKMRGI